MNPEHELPPGLVAALSAVVLSISLTDIKELLQVLLLLASLILACISIWQRISHRRRNPK